MILGASGYIGRHLVPSLIEKGYRVRGLTRDREKAAELSGLGAEPFEGDLLELSTLPRAFDGAEVVYYLVHSLRAGEDRFAVMIARPRKMLSGWLIISG